MDDKNIDAAMREVALRLAIEFTREPSSVSSTGWDWTSETDSVHGKMKMVVSVAGGFYEFLTGKTPKTT